MLFHIYLKSASLILTYLKYFKTLKEKGYKIHIYFLWIPGSQLAIDRVKDRVAQGGHNVPVVDIKRRFGRSMKKFFKNYRLLADQWMLFNNEQSKPKLIARKQNAHIDVIDQSLFEKIIKKVGVNV